MLRTTNKRKKKVFVDYSKRKKQRYFLIEFIPLSSYHDPNSLAKKIQNHEFEKSFIPSTITSDLFLKQLQQIIEEWFGLYSLAHSMFSRFYQKFIYFNEKTGLAILACPWKLAPIMSTALSLIKVPTNKEIFIVRTIFTSGSIKKCKRGAAQYQMKWINEKGALVNNIEPIDANVTLLSFNEQPTNDADDENAMNISESSTRDEYEEPQTDRFITLSTGETITNFIQLYLKTK
ncbi:hypothetical protein FDP41_003462 [Naegleria fowleri]|uniref:Uncharacterized protein n=1 Tax=Naegleria fowleri TaxID=5763 RepID=A0A6A5BUP6_NAEFO|nr:uncharacterized protein FDP41_003462 [Naegleria fowleri]KAF0977470.1 hypothetical protein FDP41_003462 [Naegleria fowleri]CAG4718563.1 unnamed protein product [Naegleria fowleri]